MTAQTILPLNINTYLLVTITGGSGWGESESSQNVITGYLNSPISVNPNYCVEALLILLQGSTMFVLNEFKNMKQLFS